ncbi:hypothetical protein CO641_12235 [Lysobacteraceae bacterium NML91-0213]|nr:hypothetical protein CO641_12235 [Xanthomonadaceae bacterium NML91-0213]
MQPAPLLHRWVAWSLDAALVAMLVLALVAASSGARLGALDAALAVLLDAVLEPLLAALPGLPAPAGLLADPAIGVAASQLASALGSVLLRPLAAFALLFWLYASAFECRLAATPGKRALGLRVVEAHGAPPAGCARHALRQASGLLSWLSLNLGHLMAAPPPRHQALHDRIAGLRVVAAAHAPLPRWAHAWLWLQAALACAASAMLFNALQARVDAALARALG